MEQVKVEIIIAKRLVQRAQKLFEAHDVKGYTVIDIARGKGDKHGDQVYEGLLPVSANVYLFSIMSIVLFEKLKAEFETLASDTNAAIYTSPVTWGVNLS